MTTTQTPQERAGYVWCSSCQRYEHPNWHGPRVATVEQTARERGEQAGRDHASWIETDSDVEMPACLSGEWAGESITELIGDLLEKFPKMTTMLSVTLTKKDSRKAGMQSSILASPSAVLARVQPVGFTRERQDNGNPRQHLE